MPVLPCQSIGQCGRKAIEFVSEKSNKISKKYTIFIILVMEIISIIMSKILNEDYVYFWFPFFANNTILLLFYKDYCQRKILKYCQRTTVALRLSIAYFALNTFVMLTGYLAGFYYDIVTYLLLTTAFLIILLTLYKPKK
jgi:hypothetical protein